MRMDAFICNACGNKTRFDIFETKSVRAFYHFTLGGEPSLEEEEVLEHKLDRVVCRWCSSTDVATREGPTSGESPA